MLRVVAPDTVQDKVEDAPVAMAAGLAVKEPMTGAVTVTVAVAVTVPLLLAVPVAPVTVPRPLLMLRLEAPETVQARIAPTPSGTLVGLTVNELITGTGTVWSVTVAVAVTLPVALVAVSV